MFTTYYLFVMPPPDDYYRPGLPILYVWEFHCLRIQPGLSSFPYKKGLPHPGQQQAGAGASPPWTGTSAFSMTPPSYCRHAGFIQERILLTDYIYTQAALLLPLYVSCHRVLRVRCGVLEVPDSYPVWRIPGGSTGRRCSGLLTGHSCRFCRLNSFHLLFPPPPVSLYESVA